MRLSFNVHDFYHKTENDTPWIQNVLMTGQKGSQDVLEVGFELTPSPFGNQNTHPRASQEENYLWVWRLRQLGYTHTYRKVFDDVKILSVENV